MSLCGIHHPWSTTGGLLEFDSVTSSLRGGCTVTLTVSTVTHSDSLYDALLEHLQRADGVIIDSHLQSTHTISTRCAKKRGTLQVVYNVQKALEDSPESCVCWKVDGVQVERT